MHTAGNESFEDWEQFEHLMDVAAARDKDEAYQKFKDERDNLYGMQFRRELLMF